MGYRAGVGVGCATRGIPLPLLCASRTHCDSQTVVKKPRSTFSPRKLVASFGVAYLLRDWPAARGPPARDTDEIRFTCTISQEPVLSLCWGVAGAEYTVPQGSALCNSTLSSR